MRLAALYVRRRSAADPDFDAGRFAAAYAAMGAQRATKILGIFARLDKRDGKPQYLAPPAAHRALSRQEPRASVAQAARRLVSEPPAAGVWAARRTIVIFDVPTLERSTMSAPIPKTAMVFAAGLGKRMRPITETTPKPLVKVAGRTLIDHCLDRLAANGVEKAIVNVHWLADQIEAHLAYRRSPKIVISDERAKLLDQGGGIRRALPEIGRDPFLLCNTDSFWIEGPRSNIARLAEAFDPGGDGLHSAGRGERACGRRRLAGRFHHEPRRPARAAANRAMSRPSSIPASASPSRNCSTSETDEVFRLAPFFHRAAAGRAPVRPQARRPVAPCRSAGDDRRGGARDRPVDPVTNVLSPTSSPCNDRCRFVS